VCVVCQIYLNVGVKRIHLGTAYTTGEYKNSHKIDIVYHPNKFFHGSRVSLQGSRVSSMAPGGTSTVTRLFKKSCISLGGYFSSVAVHTNITHMYIYRAKNTKDHRKNDKVLSLKNVVIERVPKRTVNQVFCTIFRSE
jgi:hypothetical protein